MQILDLILSGVCLSLTAALIVSQEIMHSSFNNYICIMHIRHITLICTGYSLFIKVFCTFCVLTLTLYVFYNFM